MFFFVLNTSLLYEENKYIISMFFILFFLRRSKEKQCVILRPIEDSRKLYALFYDKNVFCFVFY